MKKILFLAILGVTLSSCDCMYQINYMMEESACALDRNRVAVEMSTEAIRHNIQAIEESNEAIRENRRLLDEMSESLYHMNQNNES